MRDIIINKWEEILEYLKTEFNISPISYRMWLKDLKFKEISDNNKIIIYSDDEKLDSSASFIFNKYGLFIKNSIAEVIGEDLDNIEIEIVCKTTPAVIKHVPETKASNAVNLGMKINPDYTFDNFVVSKNNSMVYVAALKVAEMPGYVYNPLYIYGDPGLGKTHLMHSIAHFIMKDSPSLKVMYVTSEVFTNELIDSIRHGNISPSDFREKYRNIDVLLIDDIQFIIGKDSTQEEFFHTFNYLYEAKKQIVISSDKPPRDFNNLEERLRSRFECGLTVDITCPDFETKMAILKKKLEIKKMEGSNIDIDDEVLAYIAQNINTNIRSLEGALTKIIAMSKIKRTPVDMELAEYALRDIIFPNQKKVITPELIINIVAEHYEINVSDILSPKRDKSFAVPRQIAMYLSRKYTDYSLVDLQKIFNKDHSTIIHGISKVETLLKDDSDTYNKVGILIKKLNIEG